MKAPLTFIDTGFPKWLNAPASKTVKREYQMDVFDDMIELVSSGLTLKSVCLDNDDMPSFGRIRNFLIKPENHEFANRMIDAEKIAAEHHFDTLMEIANGDDDFEDVARSKLKVDTLKYLLERKHPDKFNINKGGTEVNINLDLRDAISRADDLILTGITVENEE